MSGDLTNVSPAGAAVAMEERVRLPHGRPGGLQSYTARGFDSRDGGSIAPTHYTPIAHLEVHATHVLVRSAAGTERVELAIMELTVDAACAALRAVALERWPESRLGAGRTAGWCATYAVLVPRRESIESAARARVEAM